MSKKIVVTNVNLLEEKIQFVLQNDEINAKTLTPAERVLADSDHLSFIYILETADEYVYVSIPNDYWQELIKVVKENYEVTLLLNETEIPLTGLKEELQSLIENIKGNANYGDDMMKEVERVFF